MKFHLLKLHLVPSRKDHEESYKKEEVDLLEDGAVLPLPPAKGIHIGLPNVRKTCWMNSVIKFIASQSFYDEMFTNVLSPDKKEMQQLLKTIVYYLRSEKEKKTKGEWNKILINFSIELNHFDDKLEIGLQHDAPEFLMSLIRIFNWKLSTEELNNDKFPRLCTLYETPPGEKLKEGYTKYGSHDDAQRQIDISIPGNFVGEELDLAELIQNDPQVREDINVDLVDPKDQKKIIKGKFFAKMYFTSLPETLIVNVKRMIKREKTKEEIEKEEQEKLKKEEQEKTGEGKKKEEIEKEEGNKKKAETVIDKIDLPIKINDHGYISFIRYKPILENKHIIRVEPIETCRYRIGASITHLGKDGAGHYVYEERTENGQGLVHDDLSVTEHENVKELGITGYVLRLDLVYRTPIIPLE